MPDKMGNDNKADTTGGEDHKEIEPGTENESFFEFDLYNTFNKPIYSPPYAKADLMSSFAHKKQVFVQTLNPVIQPENIVQFSGVSMDQAGDSMKRTMPISEDSTIDYQIEHESDKDGDDSDSANKNDDVESDPTTSDKVVLVTPVGVIQSNGYEHLGDGLLLNDIHDFTYNGLNLDHARLRNTV